MNSPSRPQVDSTESTFGRLWLARDVAALGEWIVFVALLVTVARFSDAPTPIGVLVTLMLVPRFLIGPIANRVVNRQNATVIGTVAQVLRAPILLPAFFLESENGSQPVLIMALAYAVAGPFVAAAVRTLIRAVVKREQDTSIRKTLLNTWLLILTLGPGFGYFIFGIAGVKSSAIAAIVALAISSAMLFLSRPQASSGEGDGDPRDPYSSFVPIPAGIADAVGDPATRQAAIVEVVAALLAGGLVVLEAAYATNGLYVSIENIGLVLAGQGIGIALAALWYQREGMHYTFNALAAGGLALVGGGALGLAVSSSLPAGIGLAGVIGLGIGIFVLGMSDLALGILANNPPRKSQRIGVGTVIDGAIVLSAAAMAPLCEHITPRFAVVIVGTLLCVLALYAFGEVPDPSSSAEEANTP